jgi:hypothetical protein
LVKVEHTGSLYEGVLGSWRYHARHCEFGWFVGAYTTQWLAQCTVVRHSIHG